MQKNIHLLEKINKYIGNGVSVLVLLLVLIISLDVLIRYLFQFSFIWITEIEIYLFAFIFLFSGGYTLQFEKHVRVDIFYSKLPKKYRLMIDIFGNIFYLIPWCLVVISYSFTYAYRSFEIAETSSQPGGLPALYLLKFSITLGFFFLLIQGIVNILKNIQAYKS